HFGGPRLHRDAEGVFVLLIGEAAPGRVVPGKDDGPFVGAGNHVQTVGSGRERLALHRDRRVESDGGVLIRARAPYLVVGHEAAPDLATVYQWAVVDERDVGEADALRN